MIIQFSQEELQKELVSRLTNDALYFILAHSSSIEFSQIEANWFASHPNTSMFLSGYIPKKYADAI